jgi:hypothetical protein
MEREIYALGDSAFMAGDTRNSPFPVYLDNQWEITRYDSESIFTSGGDEVKYNARIKRTFFSPEAFRESVQVKGNLHTLVLPKETFKKQFRWFYTYYTYQAEYKTLSDSLPVPLSRFLSDKEQRLLFQGDGTALAGKNGLEIYTLLDDLQTGFENWFQRCEFEIIYDAIRDELRRNGAVPSGAESVSAKDSIFDRIKKTGKPIDNIQLKTVASEMDTYYGVTLFSAFASQSKEELDKIVEQKTALIDLFETGLYFSLEMPGELIDTNTALTALTDHQSLTWTVDAYRFLAHDYILQAQSRTCNVWAFIVTGLILLLAVYCFAGLYALRKRNERKDLFDFLPKK